MIDLLKAGGAYATDPAVPNGEAPKNFSKQIELRMTWEGRFNMNGRILIHGFVDTILRRLALKPTGNIDLPMLLIVDAENTHRLAVAAIEGLGQARFKKLSIFTKRPVNFDPFLAAY